MRARSGRNGTWIALAIGLLAVGVGLGGCDLLWLVAPDAPTGVEATDGGHVDRIAVAWQSVPRATHYEIYRATSEDGEYTRVGESTGTTYSDTEIAVNITYWYRVKACNRAGCSTLSAADSGYAHGEGVPSVVTGVAATDGTFTDRVRVTWTAAPGATRYEVWREVTRGGPYVLDGTVTGTTYDDLDASPGRLYWYRVGACNALGCSAPSVPDSGFTFATAPDPATGVSASDGAHANRVLVTWTAAAGAATYEVHRATAEGGPYTRLADTAVTSFSDTAVIVGTTYWYRVVACNAAGCSVPSVPDSGFAQAGGGGGGGGGGMPALPGQPTVTATDGVHNDRIRVTWSAVTGATRYEIWRSGPDYDDEFFQEGETTGTSFDDTAPLMCEVFWYRIRACNVSGCGPYSVADRGYRGGTLARVTWAATPVTVTYTEAEATVTLTWTAVAHAVTYNVRYQIWRRSPGVGYALLDTTDVGDVTYTDADVALGTTYHYRIRACSTFDCITCGTFSTEVRAVVACNPAAPTDVTAFGNGADVDIEWDTVDGATRYEVYRSTTPTGAYTFVGESTDSWFTDIEPPPGRYYYKVKTCVDCGCGPLSAPSDGVTVP